MATIVTKKDIKLAFADAIIGGIMVVFGMVVRFWAIPNHIKYNLQIPHVTPEFFPEVFSIFLSLLGVALFLSSYFKYTHLRASWDSIPDKDRDTESQEDMISFKIVSFSVLLAAFIYAITLSSIGFMVGTTVLVFVLFKLFGGKKIWQGLLTSVCTSTALWFFFRVYLHVGLPTGRFWLRG